MTGEVVDGTAGDLYIPERTILHLVFDDPRLAKLQIKARSVSIGEWMKLKTDSDYVDKFADCLVWWTLGKKAGNGRPVAEPTTKEALFELEPWELRTVVKAWRKAVIGLPDPLEQPSTNGGPSAVASLPMEPS